MNNIASEADAFVQACDDVVKPLLTQLGAEHRRLLAERERDLRCTLSSLHEENRRLRERLGLPASHCLEDGNEDAPDSEDRIAQEPTVELPCSYATAPPTLGFSEAIKTADREVMWTRQRSESVASAGTDATSTMPQEDFEMSHVVESMPSALFNKEPSDAGTQTQKTIITKVTCDSELLGLHSRAVEIAKWKVHPDWEIFGKSHFVEERTYDAQFEDQDPDIFLDEEEDLLNRQRGPTKILPCVVNPSSTRRLVWDVLGGVLLCYDIITMPLAAFDLKPHDVMLGIEFMIVVYWTADIFASFLMGYYDRDGKLTLSIWKIAKNYLKTWFLLDFVIILTDWTNQIGRLAGIDQTDALNNIGYARIGKILRVLRVLRILRIVRLRKLRTLMLEFQDHVDSEYVSILVGLLKNIGGILVLNHFIACLWFWVGKTEFAHYTNWVTEYAFDNPEWDWVYSYTTSLHWSLTQFTPASMEVQPQNILERTYSIAVILVAMIIFSSFVSSVTNGMNRLWALQADNRKQLWIFRKFLRQHNISRELAVRLNRYVQIVLGSQKTVLQTKDVALVKALSEPLQILLQTEIFGRHIMGHPLFRVMARKTPDMVHHLCMGALTTKAMAQGDFLFHTGNKAKHMYFVTCGLFVYLPKHEGVVPVPVLRGEWCCEAPLWTEWVHCGRLRAKLHSEAVALDSTKFCETILAENAVGQDPSFLSKYAELFVEALNRIGFGNHEEEANLYVSDLQMNIVEEEVLSGYLEIQLEDCHFSFRGRWPQRDISSMRSKRNTPRRASLFTGPPTLNRAGAIPLDVVEVDEGLRRARPSLIGSMVAGNSLARASKRRQTPRSSVRTSIHHL